MTRSVTSKDVFQAAREELTQSSYWSEDSPHLSEGISADLAERDRIGRETYGTPLMSHNGRDPLVDLYEELLDAYVYATQYHLEGGDRSAARVVEDALRHTHGLLVERGFLNDRAPQPEPKYMLTLENGKVTGAVRTTDGLESK